MSLEKTMTFDYRKEWDKSEPQKVLDVIKEIGIHRLSNMDGCLCGGFEIRNVEIDFACGKGRDRGIYISSRSCDYSDDEAGLAKELGEVGVEVHRQFLELGDGRGPIEVHFRKWNPKSS
jgi:hypothetical protein